jgi:hypothetical protein
VKLEGAVRANSVDAVPIEISDPVTILLREDHQDVQIERALEEIITGLFTQLH